MKKLLIFIFCFSCANYDGTNSFEAEPINSGNIEQIKPYLVQGLIRLQTSQFNYEKLDCEESYIEKEYLDETTKYVFHNCLMPLITPSSAGGTNASQKIRFYGSLTYRQFESHPDNYRYNLAFNGDDNTLINGTLILKLDDWDSPQSCELKELGVHISFPINQGPGQPIENLSGDINYNFNNSGTLCGQNFSDNINTSL